MDCVGSMSSSLSLQKLVNLPAEEANKAPFPPGCKVICFLKDGSLNVGVVRSVQLSISFKAGGSFSTYYQVEIQRSWRDSKSLEVNLQQVEAEDLRFTPGSPVYVSSHYFGTESEILQGREGLIEGVLMGSFDTPCQHCRKDTKKMADDISSKRRFSYSVELKIKGVEEVVEEHGIPPEFITYRSSQLSKKEGVIVVSLDDIGMHIAPLSSPAVRPTTNTSHLTVDRSSTSARERVNREELALNDSGSSIATESLCDFDEDGRRLITQTSNISPMNTDLNRSQSFDRNSSLVYKRSNNYSDFSTSNDGTTRIDHNVVNNLTRNMSSQQGRSSVTSEHEMQPLATDGRLHSQSRPSNPERGILRSSSVDRRTSLGWSHRHNVTFADSDEVLEHRSESGSTSGLIQLGLLNTLSNGGITRTYSQSKYVASQENEGPSFDHDRRAAVQARDHHHDLHSDRNPTPRSNNNESDHPIHNSDRIKEHQRNDYDSFVDENRRRDLVEPPKSKTTQFNSGMGKAMNDYADGHNSNLARFQPREREYQSVGQSQYYESNNTNDVHYKDSRSSYENNHPSIQGDVNSNTSVESPKPQKIPVQSKIWIDEPKSTVTNAKGATRSKNINDSYSNDDEGDTRSSNGSVSVNFTKDDNRRISADGPSRPSYDDPSKHKHYSEPNQHAQQYEVESSRYNSQGDVSANIQNYTSASMHNEPKGNMVRGDIRRSSYGSSVQSGSQNYPRDFQNHNAVNDTVMESSPSRKFQRYTSTSVMTEPKVNMIGEEARRSSYGGNGKHEVQNRPNDGKGARTYPQIGASNMTPTDYNNGSISTNDTIAHDRNYQSRPQEQYNDDKQSDISPSSVILSTDSKASDTNESREDSTPTQNADEEGCYLVYSEDSGGKLVLNYSRTVIEGAVGFWMPKAGKKFQGFKFTHNQGKVDLIKGIAGGDSNRRKYYNGWCQFFKAAATSDGLICKRPSRGGIEVDLWVFYNETCTIEKVEDFQFFDATRIYAVACVPKNTMLFDGMKTGELGQFLQKGQKAGASITIDGNV